MIKIKYSRSSVCMGDDVNAGEYTLMFNDTDTLKDLIERIIDNKTERSLAFTGSSTNWIIKSNIGDLARITVDDNYKWVIDYLNYKPKDKLKILKINCIHGE